MTEPAASPRAHATRSPLSTFLGAFVDPLAVLRQFGAQGELDSAEATRFRVLWVRMDHPGTQLETHLAQLTETTVVFRAKFSLPNGSVATGHAAAPLAARDDRAQVIERTENRAVARALDALGYLVTTPAGDAAGDPVEAIDDRAVPPVVSGLRKAAAGRPAVSSAPVGPATETVAPRAGATVDRRSSFPDIPAARRGMPAPASQSTPDVDDDRGDPPLEDYSWTAFWVWAKARNLSTRGQIAAVLGHSVDTMTPAAVRQELLDHGYEI